MVIAFGGSLLLAVAGVWLSLRIARRIGFVTQHNPVTGRPLEPVALGGGVALVIVIIGMAVSLTYHDGLGPCLIAGVGPVAILGLIDDMRPLNPAAKFVGQCVGTAIYLMVADLPILWAPLAALLLLSSQNAWNLVDVADGLLGWIGATCMLGVAVTLAFHGPEVAPLMLVALAAAGASVGFLVWNSHPARVYSGDAGSLALGALYAILVIEGGQEDLRLGILLLIPGGIPFFEMASLIVTRTRRGMAIYHKTRDHFALRLQDRGLSLPRIIRRVAMLGAFLSLSAGIVSRFFFNGTTVGMALLLIFCLGIIAYRCLPASPDAETGR
jgi:UDP-GlcNAc:undecaprenyl-phosphate GlcNAc-1-phosphate transferase